MTYDQLYITLSVPNAWLLARVEIILKWEAQARGMTIGWAFYSLVNEAVDIDLYPRRVCNRVRALVGTADRQCSEASRGRFGGRAEVGANVLETSEDGVYRVQLATSESYRAVRSILVYEAMIHGLTVGQVSCRLVEDAAKPWSYPSGVRSQLERVDRELALRAVKGSLREIEGASYAGWQSMREWRFS